jgi:hypothetical protein
MTQGVQAAAAARVLERAGARRSMRLWADVLAELPLFAGVAKRHVRRIAELAREARDREGQTIVREGTRGDDFFA